MTAGDLGADDAQRLGLAHRLLDCELNDNALFLVDRLHARDIGNAVWVHLRSLCCLRLGRYAAARDYSMDKAVNEQHAGCAYVFAQACLHLKLYRDGISALERIKISPRPKHTSSQQITERFLPDAAAISCLLGKLHNANGDLQNAARCFVIALEEDAFMWDAFTNLCDCGTTLHVSNIFRPKMTSAAADGLLISPFGHMSLEKQDDVMVLEDTQASGPTKAARASPKAPKRSLKRKQGLAGEYPAEPNSMPPATDENSILASGNLGLQQRRSARLNQFSAPQPLTSPTATRQPRSTRRVIQPISQRQRAGRADDTAQREIGLSTRPRQRKTQADRAGAHLTGRKSPVLAVDTNEGNLKELYQLFAKFGAAYYQLKRYQPRAALEALASLPAVHQASPWAICKTARAQYEMMLYKDARSTFQVLRQVAPSWLEDLEVYSTVLWHLKEDVALALHAHNLTDAHFLSPQAWCAAGSSFSRQKARENAIRCFKRATQLRPPLAHAYSLLGHEYHDCEAYNEANTAFSRALQIDGRHIAAWVGLGRVQEFLGVDSAALKYYMAAEKLNPESAVVLANIARVFDKLGNPDRGLTYLKRVPANLPEHLAAYIQRARAKLCLRTGSPFDAIQDFEEVRKVTPDDADLHLMLGQAHAMLGPPHRGEALRCYTIARSLDPQSQVIKDALLALDK